MQSPIVGAVLMTLWAGLMAAVALIAATGGLGLFTGGIVALIGIVSGLLSFCDWWLYGRLICLGGDRCTIGMVVTVEPPSGKSGFGRFDSDYSFNLLLPPHLIGATQAQVEGDGAFGVLIKKTPELVAINVPFSGETAKEFDNDPATAVLHCEFEGAGMYILYQWLKGVLGLLIAAGVASALCVIPIIGWIACAIAYILGALALVGIIAGLAHAASDSASPADANPDLGGELHTNGADRVGADLVVVKGAWVYDSLHTGWNEIHPIRHCQKIGSWSGIWEFDAKLAQAAWCEAIGKAENPLTIAAQGRPENQWEIHPDVDGCDPGHAEPPNPR